MNSAVEDERCVMPGEQRTAPQGSSEGRWLRSLPNVGPGGAHFDNALYHLRLALLREGVAAATDYNTQVAAAWVVAWRKNLPDESEPEVERRGNPDAPDRDLLRNAVHLLLDADYCSVYHPDTTAKNLRAIEAVLRILWERHR